MATEAALGAHLELDLSAGIGKLDKAIRQLERRIDALRADPVEFGGSWDLITVVTVNSVACALVRANMQCPGGYRWDVTRISVGASITPVTANQSGEVFAFASNSDSDYSYAAFKDFYGSLPAVANYSPGEFVVYSNQIVYMLFPSYDDTPVPISFSATAIQTRQLSAAAHAEVS